MCSITGKVFQTDIDPFEASRTPQRAKQAEGEPLSAHTTVVASTTTCDVSVPTRLAHNLAPPLTQPVVTNETVRGPGKEIATDNATDSIYIKAQKN